MFMTVQLRYSPYVPHLLTISLMLHALWPLWFYQTSFLIWPVAFPRLLNALNVHSAWSLNWYTQVSYLRASPHLTSPAPPPRNFVVFVCLIDWLHFGEDSYIHLVDWTLSVAAIEKKKRKKFAHLSYFTSKCESVSQFTSFWDGAKFVLSVFIIFCYLAPMLIVLRV